ncbi:MAG: ATP-dependent DNA helicase [Proteobacteria bacterium]|nr:ATP-dependent DNA helicase [Pseudomonadota bacterium]
MPNLSTETDVDAILGAEGIIGEAIDDFQPRQSQLEMARLINQAIAESKSYLIEASTGIGKSYAYLVPAFLSDNKIIISTGTKNLQDQLFKKDIPLIRKILISNKKVALLKGRSNYCCLFRIDKFRQQKQFQSGEMASVFAALHEWSKLSESGDIGEFSGLPENDRLWFYATSNADNCLGSECPDFDRCFVVKARRKAMEADLVVINHHLFFSDLALKEEGFGDILPEAEVLIFDEAHQLPDIANHFFGDSLSMRQLELLSKDALEAGITEAADSKDLQKPCDQLNKTVADFRLALGQFAKKSEWSRIQKAPPIKQTLESLRAAMNELSEVLEPMIGRGKELASCYRRLETIDTILTQFLDPDDSEVSWYELSDRGFRLVISPVDISDSFRQKLDDSSFESVFFTSATISSQHSFKYYAGRLGLDDIEAVHFDSPFDYQKQSLLYIPVHLPDPSEPGYAEIFGKLCREMIEATQGYCFILFTSYRMLNWTADYLRSKIDNQLFVQGEFQRSELLQQYLNASNPVLLGTSSFWEGVDVKGDRLRCVIIDKLPFKSPQDPVYNRRLQLVNKNGGNAFVEVQIPEATIGLRQGVGRLIRDVNDQGIVVLCDNRINSKAYGAKILDSLPPMRRSNELSQVKEFAASRFASSSPG